MDTLPIYYKRESTASTPTNSSEDTPSRLSFPVSVRSFDSRQSVVPPVPPRPQEWQQDESGNSNRASRASKRGSVMLLNGPNGLWSGKGGLQQDWMKQFQPTQEENEDEEAEESSTKTEPSSLFPDSTMDQSQLPLRSSSRSPILQTTPDPPALPPRPPKLSTPTPIEPPTKSPDHSHLSSSLQASSSCPPTMSPFATMSNSSSSSPSKPLMAPPPLPARSKSPRFRPSNSSISRDDSSTNLPSSSSASSLNFGGSSLTAALGRGLKQTGGLKDKFVAGYGKGKGKLQEFTQSSSSSASRGDGPPRSSTSSERIPNSASSPQFETFPSSISQSSSSSSTSNSIRLPSVIFDIPVPRITGIAFGTPLSSLVSQTHLSSSLPPRPQSTSPITGDASLLYLPAIAYRCLEYLSEWGLKEEGIYRIPGRSNMVQQLKVLFDAGLGREGNCDLRELHPSRLDPNAVASCFKNWLRELPESLLSTKLEQRIDQLTLQHLGYTASSSNFLSSSNPSAPTPSSTTTSPNPDPTLNKRAAPMDYLEELSELFSNEMPAENFYLLRAVSYHLSLLASHSSTNKMTLTNLRLILSPTLRLSPGFLLVLVEEREIIFGGVNQDAKSRQAATSHLVTPPLLSIPAFSNPSTTTASSSKPSSIRSTSPHPPSPHAEDSERTTPIADKFSFNHSAIPLAPPPTTTTSTSNGTEDTPFIPSRRTDQTEGFFSSRSGHQQPASSSSSTSKSSTAPQLPRRNKNPGGANRLEEEEEEERKWRERERIKSADLKLSLPEDSFGLGLGLGGVGLSDEEGKK
ncbi:Rho GTPase-activating protein [Sporobolomyces salmoneus]|uniref:Rho GTPase-activating protein n=1 Tax=Sporobolomyces salmoneus TaxID=183962 RepID=UPI00316C2FBA